MSGRPDAPRTGAPRPGWWAVAPAMAAMAWGGNHFTPLLGLFGNEDSYPSPEHVDELDRLLTDAGKEHEFHRYDGAGHAFFSTNRPAYRVEAANDGWQQIWSFFGRHLGR